MKKVSQIIGTISCLLLAAFIVTGCRSAAPTTMFSSEVDSANNPLFASDPFHSPGGSSGSSTSGKGLVIKVEDMLNITFVGPEGIPIAPFDGRVSEDGYITLPLIGSIKAAGKTATELQKDIQDAYVPKYFVRLTPTVRTQDRFYYVGGEVRQPNRYIWTGEITLTKAIQTAGDFTDWAAKKTVKITHADGSTVGPFNCIKILEGKATDPVVNPGDKVFVPRKGGWSW